jgi:hypothetical protein
MAAYGLLQGLTGTWYDATTKRLHLRPTIKGDFRAFISTATGYGTVGVKKGKPFLEVKAGHIDAQEIDLKACQARQGREGMSRTKLAGIFQ